MLGRKAVDEVQRQKQALILESTLNRLKLRAELQNLWSASPLGKTQGILPLLAVLAPVAGFLTFRKVRHPAGGGGRLASAFKLLLPLYQLWKRFS